MRKNYIDYYAIQCDILKKLDDTNNRCAIISNSTGKVLTDGVYGVCMDERDLHLKMPEADMKFMDLLFEYPYKYNYALVSSIVPVSYKKKRLYKISAGDWYCYVNRRYFDFFGSQVGVYLSNTSNFPVFFMDNNMTAKGFLFPCRVCETEVTYDKE